VTPEQAAGYCSENGWAGCRPDTVASSGIAIANFDGSGEHVLTTGGYDNFPQFSPDGQWIAFLRHIHAGVQGGLDAIGLMAADGRGQEEFVAPRGCSYQSPSWSPDGRSIAAVRACAVDAAASSALVILPFEGAPVRTLAPAGYTWPVWSHDGQTIAAIRGNPAQLWLVPVDGSPPRQVTYLVPTKGTLGCGVFGAAAYQPILGVPVWSPDDRLIAFPSTYRHGVDWDGAHIFDIDVVGTDGQGLTVVSAAPHSPCRHVGQPESLWIFDWVGPGVTTPQGPLRAS
jgi:Tol biopolymer transport system component